MSRIGKQPVPVPAGVKVTVTGQKVSVTGPAGTLSITAPEGVKVRWGEQEKAIVLTIDDANRENTQIRANWGSIRAHLRNMVEGVTKGYERSLEVVGVGWTAAVAGKHLKLVVGYANPILVAIPQGLTVKVEKQIINVKGPDLQMVGQFASQVRSKRKPEPYQGKGIKYTDEVIRRKQGKQFGTATA